MSKTIKIICTVSALLFVVACVLLGFACANVAQDSPVASQPQERRIVASANRFALPNVRIDEPMRDIEVPVDGFAPGVYRFDLSVVVPFLSYASGLTQIFSEPESSTYFDFTLVSTNLPGFDTYVGEVVHIDLHYPSDTSSFVNFYIESYDGFVADVFLNGTNTYFVEVQAFDPFFVAMSGGMEMYLFVPTELFTPVARGVVIVRELIGILVSGLTGIGEAFGVSLSEMASAIFLSGEELSVFGVLIAVFAAISLGLSLTRWVLNFVTSWGNRNR